MITLQAGFKIEATAQRVWQLINWTGVEALCNTGIFARAVRFSSTEPLPGSQRIFTTADGGPQITELLLRYDDDLRVYEYRLADAGSLPIGDYEGRISVTTAGAAACLLCFSARCVPVGITEQDLREFYQRAETQIAHALARKLDVTVSP